MTTSRSTIRPAQRRRRLRAPAASLAAVLALAACGGSGQSSAGGGGTDDGGGGGGGEGSPAAEAECGEVPTLDPNDPNGLLEDMPEDVRTAFNGWPDEIEASEWADLPSQLEDGPITVGWLQQDSGSPVAASTAEELQRLSQEAQDAGEVEELLVETPGGTGGEVTAADQVRAYESLVRQGADVIISQPLSGEALVGAVNNAGEQGIPTVTFTGYVASPYALNITPNAFDGVAQSIARGVEMIGEEGNAVIMQGIEGMSVNTSSVDAAERVLSYCDDVSIAGMPSGNFNDPGAKSGMMNFLASHPEDIDLVYQVASMGAGVFEAFADAGRDEDMPLVVDNLPTAASLAWWDRYRQEQDYQGLAIPGTGENFAEAMWEVAMRTMRGEGPQINQIATQLQFITDDNLEEYLPPDAGTNTAAEHETVDSLVPADYLDGYFTNPGQ